MVKTLDFILIEMEIIRELYGREYHNLLHILSRSYTQVYEQNEEESGKTN